MGITADIRANLFCADCVNCKLIVWQSDDNDALDDIKKKGVSCASMIKMFFILCVAIGQKTPYFNQLI